LMASTAMLMRVTDVFGKLGISVCDCSSTHISGYSSLRLSEPLQYWAQAHR
jgi:hypothetical protein